MLELDPLEETQRGPGALRRVDIRAQLKGVMAGLIGGSAALSDAISFLAIPFAGPLAQHPGPDIGLALSGTMVLAAVVAWGRGLPGVAAGRPVALVPG